MARDIYKVRRKRKNIVNTESPEIIPTEGGQFDINTRVDNTEESTNTADKSNGNVTPDPYVTRILQSKNRTTVNPQITNTNAVNTTLKGTSNDNGNVKPDYVRDQLGVKFTHPQDTTTAKTNTATTPTNTIVTPTNTNVDTKDAKNPLGLVDSVIASDTAQKQLTESAKESQSESVTRSILDNPDPYTEQLGQRYLDLASGVQYPDENGNPTYVNPQSISDIFQLKEALERKKKHEAYLNAVRGFSNVFNILSDMGVVSRGGNVVKIDRDKDIDMSNAKMDKYDDEMGKLPEKIAKERENNLKIANENTDKYIRLMQDARQKTTVTDKSGAEHSAKVEDPSVSKSYVYRLGGYGNGGGSTKQGKKASIRMKYSDGNIYGEEKNIDADILKSKGDALMYRLRNNKKTIKVNVPQYDDEGVQVGTEEKEVPLYNAIKELYINDLKSNKSVTITKDDEENIRNTQNYDDLVYNFILTNPDIFEKLDTATKRMIYVGYPYVSGSASAVLRNLYFESYNIPNMATDEDFKRYYEMHVPINTEYSDENMGKLYCEYGLSREDKKGWGLKNLDTLIRYGYADEFRNLFSKEEKEEIKKEYPDVYEVLFPSVTTTKVSSDNVKNSKQSENPFSWM